MKGCQVFVCRGIEGYEIFTKAIMTPWTEHERRGTRERRRKGELPPFTGKGKNKEDVRLAFTRGLSLNNNNN